MRKREGYQPRNIHRCTWPRASSPGSRHRVDHQGESHTRCRGLRPWREDELTSYKHKVQCRNRLHTREMYLCLMDEPGNALVHRKIRDNCLDYLWTLVEPYADDLTICCESTCNWPILADFCEDHGIQFALGHAFYIKAVSQVKTKNDRVDSLRLAGLLRSNMLPVGYACPREIRPIRDLQRKRMKLVQKRTSLKTSLTVSTHMYGYDSHDQREAIRAA